MQRSDVLQAVIDTINEIQSMSGRGSSGIHGGTCPMGGGVEGFDSLNAVEASCGFSERLGCEINEDVSLFASNGRYHTVDEITDKLCQLTGIEE